MVDKEDYIELIRCEIFENIEDIVRYDEEIYLYKGKMGIGKGGEFNWEWK